jgi:flagellar motor switch/type III secretory pathway protein FliN
MTARQWAELDRGDVVTLGRRAGEPMILRVGGAVVARGELVVVDGELGVRIVERIVSRAAAP